VSRLERTGAEIGEGQRVEIFGVDSEFLIVARRDRHPAIEIDGGGQHEAAVIVGMLTDEVGAAGRAEYFRLCLKTLAEGFGDWDFAIGAQECSLTKDTRECRRFRHQCLEHTFVGLW